MHQASPLVALLAVSLSFGCADRSASTGAKPEAAGKSAPARTEAARQETSSTDATRPTTASDAAGSLAQKVFGAQIGPGDVTTLDAIVAEPGKFANKTIKTEGTVTAVCQHMGCWMEIGADNKVAHIKMAGHAFFVPKTASGHHAIVEGQLSDAGGAGGMCMHEGKDSCAGAASAANGEAKVLFEATGVQFID